MRKGDLILDLIILRTKSSLLDNCNAFSSLSGSCYKVHAHKEHVARRLSFPIKKSLLKHREGTEGMI